MKKSFILIAYLCMLLALSFTIKADDKGFYSINDYRHIDILEPTSLCKDHDGFLWVASRTDVIRISDTEHTVYNLPDIHRGANNFRLKYLYNRLIAFNTKGDILQYDEKTDRFVKLIDVAEAINNKEVYITDVITSPDGELWIASSDGLFYNHPDSLRKVTRVEGMVGSLLNVDNNTIIAVSTSGIYKENPSGENVSLINNTSGILASALYFDEPRHRLWIGTVSRGLKYYDFDKDIVKDITIKHFPRQLIRDIEAVSDSSLWCAIDGRGIWEISRNDGTLLNIYQENAAKPYTIRGNGVQEIFCENPDKVWICSFTGGVELCDMKPSPIRKIRHSADSPNSLVNNYIYEVFKDSKGNIWMGTNSGLSRWNPATGDWLNYFEEKGEEAFIVRAISEDAEGNIWVGAYSHGVFILDNDNRRIKKRYNEGMGLLSNIGFIYDIIKDSNGDMWVAGMSPEILRYRNDSIGFESFPSPVASRVVEYDDNTLILVSFNNLVTFDKVTKRYNVIFTDNLLEDVAVVDDKVWISLRGKGLISYDMNSREVASYDIAHGIISNNITSLVKDGKKLWLGSDKGICCFNTEDKTVTSFSLPIVHQCITYNPHAGIPLSDSTIGWGTSDGLLMLDSDKLTSNKEDGHIYIQDILISGQSIRKLPELMPDMPLDSIETLHVPLSKNNITVNMLPLRTGTQKVLFSWKMDGTDDEWSTPTEKGVLTYDGLHPGKHRLNIRLYHQGAVTERTVNIVIDPPFYLTWWFLTGILVIAAVTIVAVRRLRRKRAVRKAITDITPVPEPTPAALNDLPPDIRESLYNDDNDEDDIIDTDDEDLFDDGYDQAMNKEFVEKATQVVLAHLSDAGFNKDTFAKEMGVSTSLLFKKLKTTTEMSIVNFIRSVRMNKAFDMVKSGRYNVSEVADKCGFSSVGYFSTVFKKHFGKSPTDFKTVKQHRPDQTI